MCRLCCCRYGGKGSSVVLEMMCACCTGCARCVCRCCAGCRLAPAASTKQVGGAERPLRWQLVCQSGSPDLTNSCERYSTDAQSDSVVWDDNQSGCLAQLPLHLPRLLPLTLPCPSPCPCPCPSPYPSRLLFDLGAADVFLSPMSSLE